MCLSIKKVQFFYYLKYLNYFLWTSPWNDLFSDKFWVFVFLQLRKILPGWSGIRTDVHERRERFWTFSWFFCDFLSPIGSTLLFLKYLNYFLWSSPWNDLFSDKFWVFVFLQLRKILPGWSGIRTDVHKRRERFWTFSWIFLWFFVSNWFNSFIF